MKSEIADLYLSNEDTAIGEHKGNNITIEINTDSTEASVRLTNGRLPLGLQLTSQSNDSILEQIFAEPARITGDLTFDNDVVARSAMADIIALLDENTRAIVHEATANNVSLVEGSLRLIQRGGFNSVEDIEEAVNRLLMLAENVHDDGRPFAQRLAKNALEDSHLDVRVRNLALLWLHHGDSLELPGVLTAILPCLEGAQTLSRKTHDELLGELQAEFENIRTEKQTAAAIALGL